MTRPPKGHHWGHRTGVAAPISLVDDGACVHLLGARVPTLALPGTDGRDHRVDRPPSGYARLVLYAYPRTGRPGEKPLTPDWDRIPGAPGCTAESCGFRDHATELARFGASVAGVSTQETTFQQEVAKRLQLSFPLLSDADLRLTRALRLPTFKAAGQTLLNRFTIVVHAGVVEHVFHPVHAPAQHAEEVVGWMTERGPGG